MKNVNKVIIAVCIAVAATGWGAVYARAQAHGNWQDRNDLSHRLAARFGLKESEVDTFLREYYGHRDYSRSTHRDHLSFIDSKLAEGVQDRWLTQTQKDQLMEKLREKMESGPRPEEYRKMSDSELRTRINAWQKEMRAWTRERGYTLDMIKNITGKGNKYLMGVEL